MEGNIACQPQQPNHNHKPPKKIPIIKHNIICKLDLCGRTTDQMFYKWGKPSQENGGRKQEKQFYKITK